MTVLQLKKLLKTRGKRTSGNKAELVSRLKMKSEKAIDWTKPIFKK